MMMPIPTRCQTDRENELFTATDGKWSILTDKQRFAWTLCASRTADCLVDLAPLGFHAVKSSRKDMWLVTDGTYFIA